MTPDEAHEEALGCVEELRGLGIPIEIKPTKSRNDPATVAKYSGPERVKPEKWVKVTFRPQTDEHCRAIQQKVKELGWLGIIFDLGGTIGTRDWELDWSFHVTPAADGDAEAARDQLEDFIRSREEGFNE